MVLILMNCPSKVGKWKLPTPGNPISHSLLTELLIFKDSNNELQTFSIFDYNLSVVINS